VKNIDTILAIQLEIIKGIIPRYLPTKEGPLGNGHEDVWGNGCIDPHILDLGISWR
jgi:hypothetical protein